MEFTSRNCRSVLIVGFALSLLVAFVVLLISPGMISAQGSGDEATEEPIWSADMLVVEYTSVSIGAASTDLFSNVGGSAGLQIKSLWSFIPGRDLRLKFEEGVADAEDYTLLVGDLSLKFPAGSSGESSFKWPDVDVDWEDGQTLPVRIVPRSSLAEPPANTRATGAPTISGTPRVGVTLTADTSEISDADGLNNVSYSYQWIRSDNGTDTDITGETDSTYTPVTADVGKAIKIRVSFTDDRNNAETLTSQATAAVVATVPTQPLSLTVARGDQIQELDASWQAPSSNGGSAITGYKVQWKETADSWDTAADVSEATVTGTTYTITGLTGGVEYTVRVIATNVVGDGPASVEATGTPAGGTSQQNAEPENNDPTGAPTISGTEQVDQTLTADTADISDDDGLTSVSYSYQWIRTDNGTDTDIAGATDSTYTLVFADQGKTIKVRVSFTDEAGNEETLTSNPTTAVTAAPNRQARGAPTINGTVQVDQTLTADTSEITDDDGLTNVSYSYQWMADDVNIRDATGSTYTLADNDEGKAIKVKVSFTDDRNNAEARTSQATAAVAAAPNRQATGEPTDAPTVASMTITSSPNDDAVTEMDGERTKVGDWRVYGIDDSVEVTVTFSAGVTVTGKPQLELDVGGSAKAAEYKDSDGSNVKFSYTVAENDEDTDGVSIGANKLRLNGGTIRGDADQDADLSHDALSAQKKHKVDGIRPSFKTIRFSASNTYNLNGYYEEGEEVFIKVQFSEGSIYVSGTPQLTIDVGGKEREATFERTSFGDLFVYTVQEGDLDLDGPSFSANSISMNGGYIRDGAGNDVKLSHSGASANQNSKVDAVAPTVSAVAITSDPGADDTYAAGDMVEVSVTFSEEVWVPGVTRSDLPGARHPVLDLRIGNNTRSAESGLQELGRVVTFTYTIQSGDTDTDGISINANGLRLNGGVIFDDAGNNPISATIHNFFDIPLDAVVPHDAVADDPGHKVATNNNPAASAPTIGGTPQVGETLTAETSGITDADGLTNVSYSYQWLADDANIQGAANSTYTLTDSDEGKAIRVKVSFTDDAGNEETLTSATTAAVAARPNNPATGAPTISGTAQVGETLTADTSQVEDADGLTNVSYSYQWLSSRDTDIHGATDANYILVDADAGKTIKVRVSFTDDAGHEETLTSSATDPVAASPDSGPAVAIALSPSGSVAEGTEITVTMSFANLESDSDTSDTDFIFRADVVDADACEGGGMGNDRYMYKVDEDPEVRTGTISAACPPGNYTIEGSISSPADVELASATAGFTVAGPAQQQPEPPSTDATLSGLTLSDVTLAFASTTTEYTASVANDVDETTVTPTTNDGGATYAVKLDGVADADGVIPLAVGSNVITIEVTAEDGQATKTYTVTVTRAAPLSTDATLSGLALSGIDFGAFDSATTSYDVNVANGVDQTTVTATANDDGASYAIKLGGVTDDDGVIPLAVGSNVITIEVTAEDGNATQTYTVTVTRAEPPASGPAVAVALSPSGPVEEGTEVTVTMSFGGLERDSDPSDVDYSFRADVKDSANGNADGCEDQKGGYGLGVERYMKQVDEDPEVRTGTVSASCAPGDYTVKVSILSSSNVELASATAYFTVNDPAEQQQQAEPPSTDATLSGLTLSDVTLAFTSATVEYTASVANDVDETTVTPTTNDDGASHAIKLDGVADADGVVPLAVGSNVITIEVTAEDGETVKTYEVTITRAEPDSEPEASTDATLSNLALSNVDFGAFASSTTGYIASVANEVDQTTVTATANDDGATYEIKLGGVADADRVIPLAVGSNVITIEVTAEDGNTVKTYTVTVTRAEAPLSTDATLSGLTLSGIDFDTFDPAITGYTANVANDVAQTTVSPTANDDGATYVIKLDGVSDADGVIPLAVGGNVITVEVTAEDGNTAKTYTVTVTRAAPPLSADATLSSLGLSGVPFTFASDTTSYDVNVANGVDETTVRVTANDGGATYEIKLGGVTDADRVIPLAVGGNVITIEVTAEDGNTAKTYTVTVTRAAPDATAPDAPDRPTGQSTGEGAVSLDWNDVPTATSYVVRVWQVDRYTDLSADASVNGISITFNGSSATVSGLPTDYEWYYFQVSAINDAGASGWSPNNAIKVPKDEQLTAPDAPNQPEGQLTGPGEVSLDWNDVPTATSYVVAVWQDSGRTGLSADSAVKGVSITFNGSGATVRGLPTDYEWYYFVVSAINDAGASDWSDYNAIEVP